MRSYDVLMKRVTVKELTGCWEVNGHTDKDGYASVSKKRAHRVSYEHHFGSVAPGLVVCHKCDNRRCCNPEHLFVGTQKDNIVDMMRKGRKDSRIGERNTQNKLSESQVVEIYRATGVQRLIALEYGIDQSTVSNIKTGKLWGWLTNGGEVG